MNIKSLLVGVAFGFLIASILFMRTSKPVVERELAWRTKWQVREIQDTTPGYIPIPLPPGCDTDTFYYPIDSLPYREYATTDSLEIFINDTKFASSYELVFGYRGKAENYKTKPIANRFYCRSATPRASSLLLLYGGAGMNQSLNFENLELGAFGFYKRIGAHARFEIYPRDTIEVKLKLFAVIRL